MKHIVITQRQDYNPLNGETRDALDISWHFLLKEAGIISTLVPNIFDEEASLNEWLENVKPDGIILSGGNDIGEMERRDKTELLLLNYAEKKQMPVLGVCRGMQLMAYRAGANLKEVDGHVRTRHAVKFNDGTTREVNSFHQYEILNIIHEYKCVGYSSDGAIEKIVHKRFPWSAIMWHPEREKPFHIKDIKFLQNIFGS
jgi:N5-(cytidine 5'-diphosphoramidyl)-L-glutamine hydrolase